MIAYQERRHVYASANIDTQRFRSQKQTVFRQIVAHGALGMSRQFHGGEAHPTTLDHIAIGDSDICTEIVDQILIFRNAAGSGGFPVQLPHDLPSRGLLEDGLGIGSRHHLNIWISFAQIDRTQCMVIMGMGQQDIVQRPFPQHLPDIVRHGISREAEARVVQNCCGTVIDEKGAVAGDGADICNGQRDHVPLL